ncbi:MAG: TonB-dependent receptor [Reichenbachiella sp.]
MRFLKLTLTFLLLLPLHVASQETTVNDLYTLSLEDLLSIEIVSASRSSETSFDVPLSSFVITKTEIELMGAISIPEALRICPGVIVRELSNGSYDVSLRGGIDGLPSYNYTYINVSILVMIDNRPVFSSFQGGTYWQNLPISITEVEKIEVVHGPVSTLYGPNAVSGVINIITKRPDKSKSSYGSGHMAIGPKTLFVAGRGGYNLSDKLTFELSASAEKRNKYENTYYQPSQFKYVPFEEVMFQTNDKDLRYPNPEQSLKKHTVNANVYYTPSENVDLKMNVGFNNNEILYPLATLLSLATFSNQSVNIAVGGKIENLSLQISYMTGTQGMTGEVSQNNYDYNNTDLYVDYTFYLVNKRISIRPAVSFQSAYVNDKAYTVEVGKYGTFNGEGRANNFAPSLELELKPLDKWRIILGGRYELYNYPEDGQFSYQGIVNYKAGENHLFRFVTGKSYSGSFLVSTLIYNVNELGVFGPPGSPSFQLTLVGNKNLSLLENTMYEVGYRLRLNNDAIIDVAAFNQNFKNFNNSIAKIPTYDPSTNIVNQNFDTENLPLEVSQFGLTLSVQANTFDSKIQIRPNITVQKTTLQNYSPYYNEEGAFDQPNYELGEHIGKTEDIDGQGTPTVFGGLNIIYAATDKFNIDVSGYYFSKYTMNSSTEISYLTGQITYHAASIVEEKFLLNTSINYNINNKLNAYLAGYNLLNQKSAEGFASDKLGITAMIGLRGNF